jgi:hypothetical protein
MAGWQPISTATKSGKQVLLYGNMKPFPGVGFAGPFHCTGYWDEIDQAWCATTATWCGPFLEPTHWMPLPRPPA